MASRRRIVDADEGLVVGLRPTTPQGVRRSLAWATLRPRSDHRVAGPVLGEKVEGGLLGRRRREPDRVARQPFVAVLGDGDEVLDPDATDIRVVDAGLDRDDVAHLQRRLGPQ